MKNPITLYQIYALNLRVPDARPFPVGGYQTIKAYAQEDMAKLERLAKSPSYPLHNHSFSIKTIE